MFRYEYPEHLYFLAAAPLLVLLLMTYRLWRRDALSRLGNVDRIMQGFSEKRFWWKGFLFAAGLILLAIAWANPQRGAKKQTITQDAADVFIAFDISQSMLCEDVAPNRLELARVFAGKLLQELEGERIGLIFFAGNAFLQMPLSTDYSFLLQSLQSATPDLITEQGTAIAAAIELAQQSFGDDPGGGRTIILITDGENHDDNVEKKAKEAFGNGTIVNAVGVGTLAGGPIPEDDGSGMRQFKRDQDDQIVRTRLDEVTLQRIAASGGGKWYNISQGNAAIESLKREVGNLQKREMEVRSFAEFESYYQWFLLPALLLMMLEFLISFRKQN